MYHKIPWMHNAPFLPEDALLDRCISNVFLLLLLFKNHFISFYQEQRRRRRVFLRQIGGIEQGITFCWGYVLSLYLHIGHSVKCELSKQAL